MDSTLKRFPLRVALAGLAVQAATAAAINHKLEVASVGPGPFAVACSNVAQDEARIAATGVAAEDFWIGRTSNGDSRYLTQVLSAPGTAVVYDAPVPDNRSLYPQNAGTAVPHVAIVCHPTPATNPDPDYVLPGTGGRVPRMQPAGAQPRLLDDGEYRARLSAGGAVSGASMGGTAASATTARLPLVVFSHGLGGSPISPGYIDAMVDLASFGFVVGAVFHGDPRFSRIRLEDLGDVAYLFTDFDRFVEMELMRPVSAKALVDVLLAHPDWRNAIDADRIGGFGASMGGQAMANLLGARLTASLALACRETVRDPRLKAAVGLVPYAGQTFLPSFCDDQSGADDVSAPYLAISGTADTTAPIGMMEQAIHRFGSSQYLVALDGVKHEYLPAYRDDVLTWTVTFLRAYVSGDATSFERLVRMRNVAGGPADSLVVDVHEPVSLGYGEQPVVEFIDGDRERYTLGVGAAEIARLQSNAGGTNWRPTGLAFKVPSLGGPSGEPGVRERPLRRGVPVCRFSARLASGPDTRFYTADAAECASLRAGGGWTYEGIAFWAVPLGANGQCPAGHLQVLRAYNNGAARNETNHRFATSDSILREMQRKGWSAEGAAFCARF